MINFIFLNSKIRLVFQNFLFIEYIKKNIVVNTISEMVQTSFLLGEKKIVEYLPLSLENSLNVFYKKLGLDFGYFTGVVYTTYALLLIFVLV